jgi:hypothetical protein
LTSELQTALEEGTGYSLDVAAKNEPTKNKPAVRRSAIGTARSPSTWDASKHKPWMNDGVSEHWNLRTKLKRKAPANARPMNARKSDTSLLTGLTRLGFNPFFAAMCGVNSGVGV